MHASGIQHAPEEADYAWSPATATLLLVTLDNLQGTCQNVFIGLESLRMYKVHCMVQYNITAVPYRCTCIHTFFSTSCPIGGQVASEYKVS